MFLQKKCDNICIANTCPPLRDASPERPEAHRHCNVLALAYFLHPCRGAHFRWQRGRGPAWAGQLRGASRGTRGETVRGRGIQRLPAQASPAEALLLAGKAGRQRLPPTTAWLHAWSPSASRQECARSRFGALSQVLRSASSGAKPLTLSPFLRLQLQHQQQSVAALLKTL